MSNLKQWQKIGAACDPPLDWRTVRKYLEGRSLSPLSAAVIKRALRELQLPDPRESAAGVP